MLPALLLLFRLRPLLGAVLYATYLLGLAAAAMLVLGLVYGASLGGVWYELLSDAVALLIVLVGSMAGSLLALQRSGFVLLSRRRRPSTVSPD